MSADKEVEFKEKYFNDAVNIQALPVDVKLKMVSGVLDKEFKIYKLASATKVKVTRLQKYCDKVRHGKTLHEKSGRPSVLDQESIDRLREAFQNHDSTTTCDMKVLFLQEQINTGLRRGYSLQYLQDKTKFCSRSYRRYIMMLKQMNV